MNLFTYRGKRLDNGKWAYGDLVRHRKKLLIREHKEGGSWAEHEIDSSTLGVCWGMKDKNKDVFTGDTLEDCCGYKGVVFFSVERNGFCLKVGDSLHPIIQGDYYKKLGNIHENKEIIEEE